MDKIKAELLLIGLNKSQVEIALAAIEGIKRRPHDYDTINDVVSKAIKYEDLTEGLAKLTAPPAPKKERAKRQAGEPVKPAASNSEAPTDEAEKNPPRKARGSKPAETPAGGAEMKVTPSIGEIEMFFRHNP